MTTSCLPPRRTLDLRKQSWNLDRGGLESGTHAPALQGPTPASLVQWGHPSANDMGAWRSRREPSPSPFPFPYSPSPPPSQHGGRIGWWLNCSLMVSFDFLVLPSLVQPIPCFKSPSWKCLELSVYLAGPNTPRNTFGSLVGIHPFQEQRTDLQIAFQSLFPSKNVQKPNVRSANAPRW